jgi:predicted RNA-binding protein with PIN domain
MLYLIDGYNLLHAIGVLHGRTGPTGLAKARFRLLGLLHGTYGSEAGQVTVVFDATRAPPGASNEQDYQGIHVLYARRPAEADDLIESLIAHSATPRQLTVVSDDHRLQQAARRRQCIALGCLDYLDEIDRQRRRPSEGPPHESAKTRTLGQGEVQRWLDAFAGLENEADWKQLADPYGFGQLEEEENLE